MALNIGQSREIIFGEVVMAHVRDELIDPKTLYIDQLGLDAIRTHGRPWLRANPRLLRSADPLVASVDGSAGRWRAVLANRQITQSTRITPVGASLLAKAVYQTNNL
jgi:hypothetical protein